MQTRPVFSEDMRDVREKTSYFSNFKSYRITACEYMHLARVRCGHLPSCDKDGDLSTGSSIPKNPCNMQT